MAGLAVRSRGITERSRGVPVTVANAVATAAWAPAPTGGDDTAMLAALMTAHATVVLRQNAKYLCNISLSGIANLTIIGNGATLHNTTAGVDAFKAVGCADLNLWDFYAQGTSGTRDGVHLENCQRARVRVSSGGTGRAMAWAQKCVGIKLDCHLSVGSGPFPTGQANPQAGLVLTWDGSDTTSGCNEAVIEGGEYIVGQTPQSSTNTSTFTPGWAIQAIRCEGLTWTGPITELSAGGIYCQFCSNIAGVNDYCELNPSDVEYSAGTITVANGGTAVVGTATTFNNTATSPEQSNGFPGKYLVGPIGVGMSFAKVAALTDATHLTLAAQTERLVAGWPGASNPATYRLVGFDLFLDGCTDCNIVWSRGGGAIALRTVSRSYIRALTDSVLEDGACATNLIEVSANRAGTGANRVISLGAGSHVREINYQTGALVQDAYAYAPAAPTLGAYGGSMEAVRAPSATRPVLVVATINLGTAAAQCQLLMDAANPPTTNVGQLNSGGTTSSAEGILVTIVPPAFNYKLHVAVGAPSIASVAEYVL